MLNSKKNFLKLFVLSLAILITAGIGISVPHQVQAATGIFSQMSGGLGRMINQAYGGGTTVTVDQNTFLNSLIIIINVLLTFIGVVFFLLLLYAGFLWMTARGSEEQVTKAKELMKEIIIALLIIITARLLTEFILSIISKSITS